MATPATIDDAEAAVAMVASAVACDLAPDRLTMIAEIVAAGDWARTELRAAVGVLARSTTLRDALRYGRTLTPADFEEARRGDERTERDAETGDERVITTLRGFALTVRSARLYTAVEALALWNATGGQSGPHKQMSDNPGAGFDGALVVEPRETAMFTPLDVEGVGRRFRLKA